jgi:methionyl-tRNA synthetase
LSKRYLITSALPYGNGPLHFGHIAGVYLPADIYYRHLKLKGENVLHISGSDEHGVPIMLNAQKAKQPYRDYVNHWHNEHKNLFAKYEITFDFFGQTSSEYHKEETLKWFNKLYADKAIERRDEKQLQCKDCNNFLPDRFVEGTCYVCKYEHARGDECPNCGTWIDPLRLINPVCKFCSSQNIKVTDSYQYHLLLSKYHTPFMKWLGTKKDSWKKTVYPYVESLCKESLHDRAITRDLDWGIDVPLDEAKGKKIYVWFDAPIGYVSNTKECLRLQNSKDDYLKDWWLNKDTVVTNFIGKDNIIFHAIIFPVMSMVSGFAKPVDDLPANQYVNLFGKQFSKSQGWYVDADDALARFGVDAMRYYLISLIPENTDSSFTWSNLEAKVNNELANNIGNFVNRSMKFLHKNWADGVKSEYALNFLKTDLYKSIMNKLEKLRIHLDSCEFKAALEQLMSVGHEANLYFTEMKPWALYKTDVNEAERVIAESAFLSYLLGVFFKPFLPHLSNEILSLFEDKLTSDKVTQKFYCGDIDVFKKELGAKIVLVKEPQALIPKVDQKVIAELEASFKE